MSTARSNARWCRTRGTIELGSAQGSGLTEPRYLIRRGDGQVLQVSRLLQLVVHEVSAEREPAQVATAVSAAYGQELTVDGLRRLIDEKLEPFGLIRACRGTRTRTTRTQSRAKPSLSVRLRRALVAAPAVHRGARLLVPLFRPSIVLLVLAMVATADVLVLGRGVITPALDRVLATPPLSLALLFAALSIVLLCVPLLGHTELVRQIVLRAPRSARPTTSKQEPRPGTSRRAMPQEEGTTMPQSENPNADRLTADALTDDAILGPSRVVPQTGWRRAVLRASGGAVNLGPGAGERRRVELLTRVTAPISGSRRVVVMSRKGGVGKTTTTLALGSTYALLRDDRVVAVDANPDAGNLARRATKSCKRTITDLIADSSIISSYSDLRGYTGQAEDSRLEVLASDDDPRIGLALDRDAYHRAIDLLDHYYNLILLDTGTGILESANQGLLAEADQLVLVLRPALDGARAAALTLDWLAEHGYGELVTRAVVVMNGVLGEKPAMIERIEEHFTRRCATVVRVPWDRALEGGGRTSVSELGPRTRAALTELAAAVADAFSSGPSVRTTKDHTCEVS